MRPPPDPSQLAVIRETANHLLVVSGAGTGKTHTVIGKILYLLGLEIAGARIDEPIALHELAAITFTNRAARELKEKLRYALRTAGRPDLAYEVDFARIGTIHHFCGEVLRENALRAGRAPIRSVLEEGDAAAIVADAARDALVDALDNQDPDVEALLESFPTDDVLGWTTTLARRGDTVRRIVAANGGAAGGGSGDDGLDARERGLVRLAAAALDRIDARLERDGAIDFDRMIHWTRDLLRDDAGALAALRRQLRVLIIDEFQDVDPAQKEIAYLLADPESRRTDTTRLVLVGDPKQSIYRFRSADVTSWTAVERDFQERGLGLVMSLDVNYRSVPAILGFVDASIGVLLDRPTGEERADFEVAYLPVRANRAPAGQHTVEVLVVQSSDDGRIRKVADVRAIEAEAIARRAHELHAAGTAWKDMALLLQSWSDVELYEAALRHHGVPFHTLLDEGFLETREIMDLVLALEVVRDPSDERALFGFLRSPFIGVRDDTLLALAWSGRRPYWRNLHDLELADEPRVGDGETEAQRLGRAAELVRRYTRLRDRLPAGDLLDALIRETGYLGHLALAGEAGARAIANVRRFLGMARALGDVPLGDFLRALREARARQDRVPQAPVHGASDDVLTITSIHVAKGLEWDVVFWADLVRDRYRDHGKLALGRDTLRLAEQDPDGGKQPERFRALADRLDAEAQAEIERLRYVAATRARDRLILASVPRGKGALRDCFAAELLALFPALADADDGATIAYTDHLGLTHQALVREVDVAADGQSVADAADAPATPFAADALVLPPTPVTAHTGPDRHSATAFLTFSRCQRRHWLKYTAGIREPELPRDRQDELISAVRRGHIVHDVLERWREDDELDELLEDAIGRWDENAPPPDSPRGRRYREHLRAEVSSVLEHPAYAPLARNPAARRELRFLYIHDRNAAAHGAIDLAVPRSADGETGLLLLDVKTTQGDAATAEKRAQQYAPQCDVYVTAADAISPLPVHRFAFHFSRAALQVGVTLDGAARARARERFGRTALAIAAGGAALTKNPHECRFCGYHDVGLCPGARSAAPDMDEIFERLRNNRFRAGFRLGPAEREYLDDRGFGTVIEHARRFIDERIAPARPRNDGRQTPWRGHPVFVAQHATATCCRGCLEKWHGVSKNVELGQPERDYIVDVIARWLREAAADD